MRNETPQVVFIIGDKNNETGKRGMEMSRKPQKKAKHAAEKNATKAAASAATKNDETVAATANESKKKKNKKAKNTNSIPVRFKRWCKGVKDETKRVTFPDKPELLKWSGIVIGTIAVFCALILVTDTYIATPLMYFLSDISIGNDTFGWLDIVLVVITFLSGILTIIGVMLHQGEQGGLSDSVASKLTGGSGAAQKNLDKITIVCFLIFVTCLIVMMFAFPQGSLN